MAIPTISQSPGHTGQATTEAPLPRRSPIRERFDALTKRQQDEICDKYRDWNVFEDWHDCTYEHFKEDMEKVGIEIDKMYFSGFWSQGDGACFEGRVNDWPLFLASVGYTCPALTALAPQAWSFRVEHRGHYYHENCTTFSADMACPDDYYESELDEFAHAYSPYNTEIQNAAFVAILRGYDYQSFQREFEEKFKGHMRDLYVRLAEEYEYLTTDEAILDSLECNDKLEDAINSITEEEYV